ncbi:redoxin domain-containing protein [Bacillus sp. B15-48]|uniref:redoxin domain-containing protein n=1 Tax=Bacillus sp. B15-48 TaxID=1548601 RepID=UPI00193FA3D0|nr:redoxin domain-containing protein [Bacillus sp. B15-48]
MCQQQLVGLHENLDKLNGVNADIYIISNDQPENQLELYTQLESYYGKSLPFISDENLELVSHMKMKNGDTAYRGYAIIDGEGTLVLNTITDFWGEQADKSIAEIKDGLEKLNK